MSNGQNLNYPLSFCMDHKERKTRHLNLSRTMRSLRPSLRGFFDLVYYLIELVDKSCGG